MIYNFFSPRVTADKQAHRRTLAEQYKKAGIAQDRADERAKTETEEQMPDRGFGIIVPKKYNKRYLLYIGIRNAFPHGWLTPISKHAEKQEKKKEELINKTQKSKTPKTHYDCILLLPWNTDLKLPEERPPHINPIIEEGKTVGFMIKAIKDEQGGAQQIETLRQQTEAIRQALDVLKMPPELYHIELLEKAWTQCKNELIDPIYKEGIYALKKNINEKQPPKRRFFKKNKEEKQVIDERYLIFFKDTLTDLYIAKTQEHNGCLTAFNEQGKNSLRKNLEDLYALYETIKQINPAKKQENIAHLLMSEGTRAHSFVREH